MTLSKKGYIRKLNDYLQSHQSKIYATVQHINQILVQGKNSQQFNLALFVTTHHIMTGIQKHNTADAQN